MNSYFQKQYLVANLFLKFMSLPLFNPSLMIGFNAIFCSNNFYNATNAQHSMFIVLDLNGASTEQYFYCEKLSYNFKIS